MMTLEFEKLTDNTLTVGRSHEAVTGSWHPSGSGAALVASSASTLRSVVSWWRVSAAVSTLPWVPSTFSSCSPLGPTLVASSASTSALPAAGGPDALSSLFSSFAFAAVGSSSTFKSSASVEGRGACSVDVSPSFASSSPSGTVGSWGSASGGVSITDPVLIFRWSSFSRAILYA